MQPDLPNQPPQTNPNIPDYLGFEPIAEPKPKKSLKVPLMLAFSLLTLIVAGFAGYIYWSQSTPNAVFYRALGNLMETQYIERDITTTLTLKDTFTEESTVSVKSDFSDIKSPKSQISQAYKVDNTKPDVKDNTVSSELIVLERSKYDARITESTLPAEDGVTLNKWASITSSNSELENTYDKYGLRRMLNNPFSQVVIGNFKEHRQRLIAHIRENNIYTIVSTRDETAGGKKHAVFSVEINYKKLNEFTEALNKELGLDYIPVNRETTNTTEFWVDSSTGNLAYIKESVTQEHDSLKFDMSMQMEIKYPETLSIAKPQEAS